MNASSQIIISGLSCRLPDSDTPEEFWNNLINKRDMVSDTPRNWDPKDFDLPKSYGKLKTCDKFDNTFFDVHPKQSEKLDLQIRILLETIFEAIMDASINPRELSGTRTGVFIGACGSDFMTNNLNALDKMNGYEATGGANSMFANRISYTFNLKGPSLTVDTACASSLTAFDLACKAIQRGDCDYAIVGGSSFILHPMWGIAFNRLSLLSPDGRCKSFDQSGNGFVRSEGIIAVLLSKESFARKKYAKVLYSQSNNDGFTENGITFPNREAQMALLRNAYASNAIDVEKLHYIEAHGTGTPAGDLVELGAIEKVLFEEQNRSKKIYVGSVKSNMGHGEGASGLAGSVPYWI